MGGSTTFSSRKGILSCSPEDLYNFATDMRNFTRFIPADTISGLEIDKESCSFRISPLGNINFRIGEKVPFTVISYSGRAMDTNDFVLFLDICESDGAKAEVSVRLEAELNPIMKMMAAGPVAGFLEKLISGMEEFRDWKVSGR